MYPSLGQANVAALLPEVRARTLVLHRRQIPWLSLEAAGYMASHIPGAELVVLEGASGGYALENAEPVFKAVDDFIREAEAHLGGLTKREVEVLGFVAAGKSNREIAAELSISTNTVDRHISSILKKTGTANRTEAAMYAARRGLVL